MNLLSVLQMDRFSPRFYIAAATDNMSLQKARVFEDSLIDNVASIIRLEHCLFELRSFLNIFAVLKLWEFLVIEFRITINLVLV